MSRRLAGFGQVLRLDARLDRVRLPFWILAIIALPLSAYASYEPLFPTAAQQARANLTVGSNPALLFLFGPSDLSTAGGFTAFRSAMFGGLFVALMAILTVVRHTRAEEDSGRAELVSSARVGRFTFLVAAFTLASLASIAAGGLAALGLIGLGADTTGSVLLGASLAFTGFAFGGVAAVCVQIGAYARTATSIALGVLGASFLLRAWGDSSVSLAWVSWLSPLGWTVKIRAFSENNPVPLLPMLVAGSAGLLLGIVLRSRRDLGMSLIPPRDGQPHASRYLSSGFGLTARLQRSGLITWGVGLMIAGVIVGSVSGSLGEVLGQSGIGSAFAGGGDFESVFLTTLVSVLGILAAGYGVQAALHARSEETEDRVEPLLATPLTRIRWFGGYLVFAFAGSALVVLAAGITLGLAARGSGADAPFSDVVATAAAQTAAVWVLVGIATALVGLFPRATFIAWIAIAITFVLTIFGPLLNLSDTVLGISPFRHIPDILGGSFEAQPILILVAIAGLLVLAGLVGIRRRDIQ